MCGREFRSSSIRFYVAEFDRENQAVLGLSPDDAASARRTLDDGIVPGALKAPSNQVARW